MTDDLVTLAGGPVREVLLGTGARVQVSPLVLDQIGEVLALGPAFATAMQIAAPAAPQHSLYVLLAAAPGPMRALIALGSGLPEDLVGALPVMEAVQLLDAVLAVNADFFGWALGLMLAPGAMTPPPTTTAPAGASSSSA